MEHSPRAHFVDFRGQVVLQRQCELIVHVHLNRDEQEFANAKNGNSIHVVGPGLGFFGKRDAGPFECQ
jgi:hypothetical protein